MEDVLDVQSNVLSSHGIPLVYNPELYLYISIILSENGVSVGTVWGSGGCIMGAGGKKSSGMA